MTMAKDLVLVVSAHAADFVWRAGGTIALYAERGHVVRVVRLSFGERVGAEGSVYAGDGGAGVPGELLQGFGGTSRGAGGEELGAEGDSISGAVSAGLSAGVGGVVMRHVIVRGVERAEDSAIPLLVELG